MDLPVVGLVVGFPFLLLVMTWGLGRLEAWMLEPDERAEQLERLLEDLDRPDEVEREVAMLLAEVADSPSR